MDEYISKSEAIKEIRTDPMGGLNYERLIRLMPGADVVEVVKCKDCENRFKVNVCPHSGYFIENGTAKVYCNARDDDFCSRGKQRAAGRLKERDDHGE